MPSQRPTHQPRFIDNGYIQLISEIGTGAYGVVYYALDYLYGRPIKRAVKQLRRHGIDERQRRFQLREIELHHRASRHGSIVGMDRLVEEHDCVYVVMDYGDEGDSFAMITEKQRYAGDNDSIRSVFSQILDGVDWLHQLGIAHRDVKPENIVCSNDGTRVRIVDFGSATSESTSTEFGCGSTFYIAPECLGEWSHNATSYPTRTADVWSLGVILVNLVCGRNPWRCASPGDESFTAFSRDPNFLRRILPISNACSSISCQIFTLDPAQRITLDRSRKLISEIDSFTDDKRTSCSRRAAVPPPVVIPQPAVAAPYVDTRYYEASSDAEPVFSFDEPELDIHDSVPPSLRADTSSPRPQRSSSGSSESPFPPTPRLDISGTIPGVETISSLTTPVFEQFEGKPFQQAQPGPLPYPQLSMSL